MCGGRSYNDRERVFDVLDGLHAKEGVSLVIQGAMTGADRLAEDWARSREIMYVGIPARWQVQGRKAGPIRNS